MPRLRITGKTIVFDEEELAVLLRRSHGETGRDMSRRASNVYKRVKRAVPVRSGTLRDSISMKVLPPDDLGPRTVIIVRADHALAVEFGRRPIFNPSGQKLEPKAYSTKYATGEVPVTKKAIAGTIAARFMRDSVDAALD